MIYYLSQLLLWCWPALVDWRVKMHCDAIVTINPLLRRVNLEMTRFHSSHSTFPITHPSSYSSNSQWIYSCRVLLIGILPLLFQDGLPTLISEKKLSRSSSIFGLNDGHMSFTHHPEDWRLALQELQQEHSSWCRTEVMFITSEYRLCSFFHISLTKLLCFLEVWKSARGKLICL